MYRVGNNIQNVLAVFQFRASFVARSVFALLLATSLMLSGCGARHQQAISEDEYVEIENPNTGENPLDASPTMWVPRKMAEKGLPRGKALVQKAYDKAFSNPGDLSAGIDVAKPQGGVVLKRLLVAEAGEQTVGATLRKFLSSNCIVNGLSRPSESQQLSDSEKLTYITGIAGQLPAAWILLVSKPEGIKPGARIKADLYDIRIPQLIRSYWVVVRQPLHGQNADETLIDALQGLAGAVLSSLEATSWYGKVVSVSGERIYIDAGAETGLKAGHQLRVHRGGEIIKGLGFAPGERITSFAVTQLFGQDGSYGVSSKASLVKNGDYVELEK